MAANIESIYNDFRASYQNDPDFIIDFCNKHLLQLNNKQVFKDKEELGQYIELTGNYAEAIYRKDRYNEAIDLINKYQVIIDAEIERLNASGVRNAWYYSLAFVKGMASYKLRDYKTATSIFKMLTQVDRKNDVYKNWLSYSSYGKKIWLVRGINIVCLILIGTEMFFKSSINNYYVNQTLLAVGLLGFLSNWAYEAYIKRSFRKVTT